MCCWLYFSNQCALCACKTCVLALFLLLSLFVTKSDFFFVFVQIFTIRRTRSNIKTIFKPSILYAYELQVLLTSNMLSALVHSQVIAQVKKKRQYLTGNLKYSCKWFRLLDLLDKRWNQNFFICCSIGQRTKISSIEKNMLQTIF